MAPWFPSPYRQREVATEGFHPRQCQSFLDPLHATFALLHPRIVRVGLISWKNWITLSRNSFSSKFLLPSLFLIMDLSGPMPPLNQKASFLALKSSEESIRCGILGARWLLSTWWRGGESGWSLVLPDAEPWSPPLVLTFPSHELTRPPREHRPFPWGYTYRSIFGI